MSETPLPPGINIIQKKGIGGLPGLVEETVGRFGSIGANILRLTPRSIISTPSEKSKEYIEKNFADFPWKGKSEVYLGHSPLFKQLGRLFSKDRRTNLFARVALGIPYTGLTWLAGKLGRMDSYNPFTESAQVYHSNEAMALKQAGYAAYFDQSKHPTLKAMARGLVPFVGMYRDWRATNIAMQKLDKNELKKASRVLTPDFAMQFGFLPVVAAHIQSRITGDKNIFHNPPQPREARTTAA